MLLAAASGALSGVVCYIAGPWLSASNSLEERHTVHYRRNVPGSPSGTEVQAGAMKTGAGAASKAGGRASASGGDGGAAGGRAGRKVKEAQDASAAPAQEEGLNKALQAKPYKKFDEKTQTWKTVFITPEAPAEPVDYKKLYDVPDCPVFYPTAKEFNHPGKYIESISEQVRAACRVIPPAPSSPRSSECRGNSQTATGAPGTALWNLQDRAAAHVEAPFHDRPQELHGAHACAAGQLPRRPGSPAAHFCREPLPFLVEAWSGT